MEAMIPMCIVGFQCQSCDSSVDFGILVRNLGFLCGPGFQNMVFQCKSLSSSVDTVIAVWIQGSGVDFWTPLGILGFQYKCWECSTDSENLVWILGFQCEYWESSVNPRIAMWIQVFQSESRSFSMDSGFLV